MSKYLPKNFNIFKTIYKRKTITVKMHLRGQTTSRLPRFPSGVLPAIKVKAPVKQKVGDSVFNNTQTTQLPDRNWIVVRLPMGVQPIHDFVD